MNHTHDNLQIDEIIKPLLKAGEHILWAGEPDAKRFFHIYDLFIIPFGLFFTAFAVYWEYSVMRLNAGASILFILFGSIFIAFGFYISIGRLFFESYIRKRTTYVLTDKRAFILVKVFKQSVKAITIDKNTIISKHIRKDGSGHIKFGQDRVFNQQDTGWNYNPVTGFQQPNMSSHSYVIRASGFYDIEDAERVYNIAAQAQKNN